jgi:hypothetical protein
VYFQRRFSKYFAENFAEIQTVGLFRHWGINCCSRLAQKNDRA